jgi:N-methylhydantoinase A
MILGVDVGGTFTDAVLAGPDGLYTAKAPSTPEDQSRGVLAAIDAVLEQAGAAAPEIERFAHGMTVATNALLEGRSARTALIATEGFSDLVALGRQARPELYRLCAAGPAPLVPDDLRFEAAERMTPDGPLRGLDPEAAERLAAEVAAAEVKAVAVCLLHAYRHPAHELELARALHAAAPDLHVSLSHELVGTFREYERAATTEVDAALSPLLAGYLHRLAERCAEAGLPHPAIMSSAGGLISLEQAAGHAALTVLSGPAAGAAGAAHIAARAGCDEALCFDMGGTSCDVCVVQEGRVAEQSAGELAGRPLALPMLAIHTVGAGGGSIAWRDPGGALRVGPRSAGAQPGPAAYGRGATEPTVTDANLTLGRIGALEGGIELDRALAQAAIERLATRLGIPARDCAGGIIRVANAEMVRALRVVSVERGLDPRRRALVAFGGAGGLHACAIARELGMTKILCARSGGVLAALGLVVAPARRDAQQTVMLTGDELSAAAVAAATAELARRVMTELPEDAGLEATYELRYRGQSFELPVRGELQPTLETLRAEFERVHEERYGFRDPDGPLELVAVRVTGRAPAPPAPAPREAGTLRRSRRPVVLDGGERELPVLGGSPPPGTVCEGPAIVELPGSTVLVEPGWTGEFDADGTLRLERR